MSSHAASSVAVRLLAGVALLSCAREPAWGCCTPRVGAEVTWTSAGIDDADETWLDVDARGGVYALWTDSRGRTTLAVSRDDGATWDTPATPVGTGGVRLVGAALDDTGTLVLAWVSGTRVLTARSTDQGGTFGAVVQLADNAPHQPTRPRLAFGPGGPVAVAWVVVDAGGSGGDGIWAAASADRGQAWSVARRIDAGPAAWPATGLARASLSVAASGDTAVVGWLDARDGEVHAYLDRTTDGGASWATDVRIDTVTAPVEPVRVAVATTQDGAWQAAYSACALEPFTPEQCLGRLATHRVNVSTDDAATWPAADSAIGTAYFAMRPTVVALASGRVHVIWGTRDPGETVSEARMSSSPDRGLPGTWYPMQRDFATAGLNPHHFRAVVGPAGILDVVHDDYRDFSPSCNDGLQTCESIYLDRSCDDGLSWLPAEFRLDDDADPNFLHSEDPSIALGASGRMHVLWVDLQATTTATSNVQYRGLDTGPDVLPVTVTAGTTCTRPTWRVEVVPGTVGACPDPTYQWFVDGMAVPGATGPTFDVPGDLPPGQHAIHYEVTCSVPLLCGDRSRAVYLDVPDVSTAVVAGDLAGILRVARRGTGLRLSWTDSRPEAVGYNVYAGTVDALFTSRTYDHAQLRCHVLRSPAGASSSRTDVGMPSADTCYLVAPAGCLGEGTLGADSFGRPRPVPGSGPACGAVP
jgi:hypothetical protein